MALLVPSILLFGILEHDRRAVQGATPSTIDVPHGLTIVLVQIYLFLKLQFFRFNQDFYDIYIN